MEDSDEAIHNKRIIRKGYSTSRDGASYRAFCGKKADNNSEQNQHLLNSLNRALFQQMEGK